MTNMLTSAPWSASRTRARDTVVRPASGEEVAQWDRLVARFPNHRVMHQLGWIRSLENSVRGQAIFLVFENDGEIVGCLPGLVTHLGPLCLFGSPLPGWQTASLGPVFDAARVSTADLMSATLHYVTKTHGVHYVELINADLNHDAMRGLGFRGAPVPTYRAPLFPGDEARTFKQLKDSARRNVRRAVRLGLMVRVEEDESFVDEAYDQIHEVFIRGGHQVPFSKRRVLEFFRCMKADRRLVAVSVVLPDGATRIAAGLFTIDGRELLLWQWSHRTAYRWFRPTELMTWTVMQRAMSAGCTTFDLMGLGEFKGNFGASPDTSQYRWMWSRPGALIDLRDLAEACYRRQQSARGQLARWWRDRFGQAPVPVEASSSP